MNETLENNIAKCVIQNVRFRGGTPATYTVQNCFDGTLSINSIKGIARAVNKELQKITTDDLFEAKPTPKIKNLELVRDTLVGIVEYRVALETKAAKAAQTRRDNAEELSTLTAIRAEKQIEALKGKGMKTLEKRIAELESVEEEG